MTDIRAAAAGYYAAIDRSDTESVVRMFADTAVYDRAGVEYRDISAIRKFFGEDRQVSGTHAVQDIWSDEASRTVIVTGRFDGHDLAGAERTFGFCDIWRFDETGLVSRRQSFLALG